MCRPRRWATGWATGIGDCSYDDDGGCGRHGTTARNRHGSIIIPTGYTKARYTTFCSFRFLFASFPLPFSTTLSYLGMPMLGSTGQRCFCSLAFFTDFLSTVERHYASLPFYFEKRLNLLQCKIMFISSERASERASEWLNATRRVLSWSGCPGAAWPCLGRQPIPHNDDQNQNAHD